MENRSPRPASHEEACARVAARFSEPWLRHYSGSKLRSDPVFRATVELLRETEQPLLDVGGGVGLLPFYLRERGFAAPITVWEIDARKVRRARAAAKTGDGSITFLEQDVRGELPPFSGNVALLDVLHYLDPPRQEALLRTLAAFVAPGGMLLIRDCPRDGSPRFWMTYAGEIFAQAVAWNIGVPLHFPTRESINAVFDARKFAAEEKPMSGGGPFNNRLFIYRRR